MKLLKNVNAILCHDFNYGIGKNNKLAWQVKRDLEQFKEKT